jgi:hypothetical protein
MEAPTDLSPPKGVLPKHSATAFAADGEGEKFLHEEEAKKELIEAPPSKYDQSISVGDKDKGTSWSSTCHINGSESFNKEQKKLLVPDEEEPPAAAASGQHEDEQQHELEEDVFSVLFVSPIFSVAFMYSIFIVAVQMIILILCLIGLFRDSSPGNYLQIPVQNEFSESLAQALAIMVSIFVSGDIVNALCVFDVKYSTSVQSELPGAKKWKWYFTNVLRLSVGGLGLAVAFFFIVQGTDALGLFLDFAVVQFVSELDDIAFHLADKGVLALQIQEATRAVKGVRMGYKSKTLQKSKSSISWKVLLYLLLSVVLFVPWAFIKSHQHKGLYFNAKCQTFEIWFKNNSYDFFRSTCPKFVNSTDREECPSEWNIAAHREEGVNYQSFNDLYYAAKDEKGGIILKDNRPFYYQRSEKNTDFGLNGKEKPDPNKPNLNPPGKISYCKKVDAWVFSIEGISKGANAGDCSWLMKSPETKAFYLGDVPEEDWVAWTGLITETIVDITCAECEHGDNQSVDCNFRGDCSHDTETCDCYDDFMGFRCEACTACRSLQSVGFLDALENENSTETETIGDTNGFQSVTSEVSEAVFMFLADGNGADMKVYDRPVHYFNMASQNGTSGHAFALLVYTGSQYTLRLVNKSLEQCIEYLEYFHSMWDFDKKDTIQLFETEETRVHSPIGLKWFSSASKMEVNFLFGCKNNKELEACNSLGVYNS